MRIVRLATLLLAAAIGLAGCDEPCKASGSFCSALNNSFPFGPGIGHEERPDKTIEIAALMSGHRLGSRGPEQARKAVDGVMRYAADIAAKRGWEAFEIWMSIEGWRETTTRGASSYTSFQGQYIKATIRVPPGRPSVGTAKVYRTRDILDAPKEPLLTHSF